MLGPREKSHCEVVRHNQKYVVSLLEEVSHAIKLRGRQEEINSVKRIDEGLGGSIGGRCHL